MVSRPLPKDEPTMNMTTGAILRRITETDLSVSAHKLATIILDGIAWKDGYNGLERGTAAFTLAHLADVALPLNSAHGALGSVCCP